MINTRQARVSDHRFLKALHHAVYREVVTRQFGSWNECDQDAWFEKSLLDAEYRIVESDGTPIGTVGVRDDAEHIALVEMQISPEYQNKGIGTELLALELKRAADFGLPVRLQVLRQNHARRFYARNNFIPEGETNTHYLMVWNPKAAPALADRALGRVVARPKLGSESFRDERGPLELSLLDFWRWSSSDLISNTLRGRLAEFLVGRALGLKLVVRQEWDPYDLELPSGLRIEVKSASYLQSWAQRKHSAVSFDIAPTLAWDPATGLYASEAERGRQAELYVFALLAHGSKATLNPLDVTQWEFYTLGVQILNQRYATQKRLSLSTVRSLGATKCSFRGLSTAVEAFDVTEARRRPTQV